MSSLLLALLSAWAFAAPQIPIQSHTTPQFPCTQCHRTLADQMPKGVKTHTDLKLQHMEEIQHCRFCHSAQAPNSLVLMDLKPLPVTRSPELCAQCHGPVFNDWNRGIHGKITGGWKGDRKRLTCVACHDPHHPKFTQMDATATPKRPKNH